MTKWDYCAVSRFFKHSGDNKLLADKPVIWYFTGEGVKKVDIRDLDLGIGRTIAQLGEDGWEMVGVGPILQGTQHILYFRRSKS